MFQDSVVAKAFFFVQPAKTGTVYLRTVSCNVFSIK